MHDTTIVVITAMGVAMTRFQKLPSIPFRKIEIKGGLKSKKLPF